MPWTVLKNGSQMAFVTKRKLKRCLCGSDNVEMGRDGNDYRVACLSCGTAGPPGDTYDRAARAWNENSLCPWCEGSGEQCACNDGEAS